MKKKSGNGLVPEAVVSWAPGASGSDVAGTGTQGSGGCGARWPPVVPVWALPEASMPPAPHPLGRMRMEQRVSDTTFGGDI